MEPPKKHVVWIDVSRVLAALLIMYVHLSSPLLKTTGIHLFYNGRVPFFLVLAGYFLARNITWHKVFDRTLWLFIPYMIWNGLYLFLLSIHNHTPFPVTDLVGIKDVFIPGLPLFPWDGYGNDVPPIGPSWFLRDIMILTLLTPLLIRVKILLAPALILFFSFCNMAPDPMVTISIGSCAFYLLGVALSSCRINDIHLVLNEKFSVVFCLGLLVSFIMILLHSAGVISLWTETVPGMLLGVMLIMYAGIWMEKHLPRAAAKIALLAPACFLTFMLHMPIYKCLPSFMKFGIFAVVTPLLTFTMIALFYFALKHFTPCLLPYLAHVKKSGYSGSHGLKKKS